MRDDCYAATASLVAVRLILAWMLAARRKVADITMFIGDIRALIKDGEVLLAEPPPEWKPEKLKNGRRIIWKLRKALYGLRTSPKRWQDRFGEIINAMGVFKHPHDPCIYIKKVEDTMIMMCCHVADHLVVGKRHLVAEVFEELKNNPTSPTQK